MVDLRPLHFITETGVHGHSADGDWQARLEWLRPPMMNRIIFPISRTLSSKQPVNGPRVRAPQPALRHVIDPSIPVPWRP